MPRRFLSFALLGLVALPAVAAAGPTLRPMAPQPAPTLQGPPPRLRPGVAPPAPAYTAVATASAPVPTLAPAIHTLTVSIATGNDDLREGSEVHVGAVLTSGETLEMRFSNPRERLADRTIVTRDLRLPREILLNQLAYLKVRFVPDRRFGMNDDQWEMLGLSVVARARDGRAVDVYESATSLTNFDAHKFSRASEWETRRLRWGQRQLAATVTSGSDDLRHGSHAEVQVEYADGQVVSAHLGAIPGGQSRTAITLASEQPPGPEVPVHRVRVLKSQWRSPIGATTDEWDFDGVRVDLAQGGAVRQLLFERRGARHRFGGSGVWESPVLAPARPRTGDATTELHVRVLAGEDDGRDNIVAEVELRSGEVVTGSFRPRLYGGQSWVDPHGRGFATVTFPRAVPIQEIRRVSVVTRDRGDQFDLASVQVLYRGAGTTMKHLWADFAVRTKLRGTDAWRSPVLPTFAP